MQVINHLLSYLYSNAFIYFTFIRFVGMDRAIATPCYKTKVRSIRLHLHRGFAIVDNYKNQFIIWITTFNAESSIWRSCYLRLTLYGFPETPFSNHFKTCNPKSIEPNNYKRGNIRNYKLIHTNKKII